MPICSNSGLTLELGARGPLVANPARLASVQDEPALPGGRESVLSALEWCLGDDHRAIVAADRVEYEARITQSCPST